MKYYIFLFSFWAIYWFINIGIAEWNDEIVVDRLKANIKKQINHPAWAFYYCVVCTPMWFLIKDWFFMWSIALLHISVFPVAYNKFRKVATFNLSTTTTAITDRFMVWIGLKSTAIVNIGALVISVALLIISFFQKH